jgi:beta-glucosidase
MPASELPSTAGLRRNFIWGVYCQNGEIKNHDTGDIACDHYHRYREDIALMKRLGVQAYRFSVAWPRILPRGQGSANEPGLCFYDRLIDELLTAGIQPWLCLYHWDLPQALEDLGGWINRESAAWFADYTRLVATRFGDRVKHFATFNEPSIFSLFGRSLGKLDRSCEDNLHRTIHHVNLAHGAAVDVLREKIPGASIGCIHTGVPLTPIEWPINPEAFSETLRIVHEYSERFGLTYVDYASLQRIPKSSFHCYADLIRTARQR